MLFSNMSRRPSAATRSKTQLKRKYAAAVAGANHDTKQLLSESRQAFIDWAVENAVPIERLTPNDYFDTHDTTEHNTAFFQSLKGAIQSSSAAVVMLSEGFHNCKEMMSLHHVIIDYLIYELGYNVVASESGLPESKVISNHIQNPRKLSCDEEDELWTKGLNKMYSAWFEGRDLIEMLAAYNIAQASLGRNNFVDYCGLDIGGFYSDWTHPISMIQTYIKQQLPKFERDWSQQMNPLLNTLGTSKARYNYQHILTAAEKNKLALLLDELVNMLTSKRDDFDGDLDFEWTRQSAISMQHAENYYRNYEHMTSDNITKKYTGLNGREIAMADNILWRLNLNCSNGRSRREQTRMIVINHVIHTKTATQYQGETWGHFVPMGQMVKEMLDTNSTEEGKKQIMFNIGMVYGGGTFWDKWQRPNERVVAPIPPPKEDGLEAAMEEISERSGMKNFFIHWETAPSDAFVYLHNVTTIRENDYFIRAFPMEWNGCIYLDHVTHATADNEYRIN